MPSSPSILYLCDACPTAAVPSTTAVENGLVTLGRPDWDVFRLRSAGVPANSLRKRTITYSVGGDQHVCGNREGKTRRGRQRMERPIGIEPTPEPWQGSVLPLY